MPVRATKRGRERTRFQRGDCDVLVCGASFAGLAVARELAGSGARVLLIDRYELGERQTSACAMPTPWMQALDVMGSWRQSFDRMTVHTRFGTAVWPLPWSFSTFDYREICALLRSQSDGPDVELETAAVIGRAGSTVHTDRGDIEAPLIVDALGWRRVLSNVSTIQPPDAPLSRGLEVHPPGTDEEMRLWIHPRLRSRRLRLELSGPRRASRRCGLVLAGSPRQGAHRQARRRAGPGPRWLSGQLDPPQAAARDRGWGLLRGRLGRTLPAPDRRGHPYRAVLRAGLRTRAARRARGPPLAHGGARALRRVLRSPRAQISAGCWEASGSSSA